MLKIYHARGTRSVRPIWLCFELNLPVEIAPIDFSQAYRDTPEWRALSPTGKVPAMTDGDLTMFESGAMVEYILERYGQGRLRPASGTTASALHLQWCWYAEATLVRPIGLNRMLKHTPHDRSIAEETEEKARGCLEVVDRVLADRDYLLGAEFGAADIMMGYSLNLLANNNVLDDRYPRAQSYLARLQGRDAYRRLSAL